jgi:glucosamine-6-phosphate deaminase
MHFRGGLVNWNSLSAEGCSPVRLLVLSDPRSVGLAAARFIADMVREKPAAAIGLAAGATPLAAYAELVRSHRAGEIDLSRIEVFVLDEYLGIGPDHPAGCVSTILRHFVAPLGLPAVRVHTLAGVTAEDAAARAAAHERAIADAGGLDLQILGLGQNGHIGFNEPGTSLAGRTGPAVLSASTRAANRPAFAALGEETPPAAITMGVGTILAARHILLLATGAAKAEAVAKMAEGPVTAMVPASALQLHPEATVMLDEAAAAKLSLRDDYRTREALFFEGL